MAVLYKMSLLKKYFLLILLLILISPKLHCSKEVEPKNVLMVFSMSPKFYIYKYLLENFENTLWEEYKKPYKIYTEYLDLGNYPALENQKHFFDQLNSKYKNVNLDLLICIGPQILPYLEKHADSSIINLPTISLDMKNPLDKNLIFSLHPNTTELRLDLNPKKNLELAFKLFPDYSTVYLISGSAAIDRVTNNIIQSAFKSFEKHKRLINLNDLTMEELLSEVEKIPAKSIILMSAYSSDANNIKFTTREVIRYISRRTEAPIFVTIDTPFDERVLGGYVMSFTKTGTVLGQVAKRIFNKENPGSIHIKENLMSQYMFNWKELNRFGLINSDLIPANSLIVNKEVDFFDKYKWLLLGGIIFIIAQSLIIISLIRLIKKQRFMTKQIVETENRYRELVREDRLMRMAELTASISHELKQPLTAILTSAQAGQRFLKQENPDLDTLGEIFQNITEDDIRAASIIDSIKSFMKREDRKKEKVDIDLLINQTEMIIKGELYNRKIEFVLNSNEKPTFIFADPIQIQQVLLNLLFNAIHSMENMQNQDKKIILNKTSDDDKVKISVSDFGSGISDDIKNKLFKPFSTTREKGFGIGLAVSKSIIDSYQGKIYAENNFDGGATFSFELPIYINE